LGTAGRRGLLLGSSALDINLKFLGSCEPPRFPFLVEKTGMSQRVYQTRFNDHRLEPPENLRRIIIWLVIRDKRCSLYGP
jgi:hypothetical protein